MTFYDAHEDEPKRVDDRDLFSGSERQYHGDDARDLTPIEEAALLNLLSPAEVLAMDQAAERAKSIPFAVKFHEHTDFALSEVIELMREERNGKSA
jgi:hypothetical protein